MARPKKNAATPGARQRILSSYWELAQGKTFADIAVDQVLKRAKCNRTTFYYHFENLAAVRNEAEENRFSLSGFEDLFHLIARGELNAKKLREFYANNSDALRYMSMQLQDGQGETAARVNQMMRNAWIELGLLSRQEGPRHPLVITQVFLAGGLVACIGRLAYLDEAEFLATLDSYAHTLGQIVAPVLLGVLDSEGRSR